MGKSLEDHLRYDRWLSTVMNREVYQLRAGTGLSQCPESSDQSLSHILCSGRVFAYSKITVNDIEGISCLERMGFNLIETNVTFEKAVENNRSLAGKAELRFARAEDKTGVETVASRNFLYSRFHMDPVIPDKLADEVKRRWAGNYFLGNRGDNMVVALIDRVVAGFLLLIYGPERTLIIDLIGVDKRFQRRGIARDMIAFSEKNINGFSKIRAGTQIVNRPSIGLYEKSRFRIAEAVYTLHFHRDL